MSKIEQNTTDLQAILAAVNSLPEAGGGGGSVETCTVTFDYRWITLNAIAYSSPDGAVYINQFENKTTGSVTFANVLKGSAFMIYGVCFLPVITTSGDITLLGYENVTNKAFIFDIKGDCTINMYDDD